MPKTAITRKQGSFIPGKWRARRDSNPRPSVPKTDALSTELQAHIQSHCYSAEQQKDLYHSGWECAPVNIILSVDSR